MALKKGTIAVNIDKIEFAEDKMSATITTTTNLTKGDYTVSVTGLTEEAITATVTVENEKVAKINVAQKAPRVKNTPSKATVSYEVLNQYGEKVTGKTINWTISTGKAAEAVVADKTINITSADGNAFVPGSKVYVTGVHTDSATVVNAEVEIVLEAKANTVDFKGVYNTVKEEFTNLPAGFENDKYVLLVEVKDQYGNKIENPTMSEIVFTSSNPMFVASTPAAADDNTVTINDVKYQAVKLARGSMPEKGGKVTIQAISTITGAKSTYEIDAEELAAVKTFAMSAPSKMVAEKETIEIPFTAVDQYGNAVTKYDSLNGKVSLSPAGLKFVKQNDGSAKLEYTAPADVATANADYPVYLTSLVTQGGNFSSLMINVRDEATPKVITGLNAKKTQSIAAGNFQELLGSDLVIQDQYGREMTKKAKEDWLEGASNSILVKTEFANDATDKSPFKIQSKATIGAEYADADAATKSIAGKAHSIKLEAKTETGLKKTEKVVFSLVDSDGEIESSSKSITFTSVERSIYESYEVEDLGTMYNDGKPEAQDNKETHKKTVKVYGVLANGTKVLLPNTDYTVTTDGKLAVENRNEIVDAGSNGYDKGVTPNPFKDANGNDKDIKVNVLVTVNDTSGAAAAILQKELLVSNKAPEVATIGLDSDKVTDGKATITANGITNAELKTVIDTEEVKDQYGVKMISEQPVITITKLVKVEGSAFTVIVNGTESTAITGAKLGDKFTATYKYDSGKTVAVDFTVGLDDTAPAATASASVQDSVTAGASTVITFSEQLDATSKAAVETAIKGGVGGVAGTDLSFTWNNNTVTVTNNHASTAATFAADVTVSNVKDLAGNNQATVTIDLKL